MDRPAVPAWWRPALVAAAALALLPGLFSFVSTRASSWLDPLFALLFLGSPLVGIPLGVSLARRGGRDAAWAAVGLAAALAFAFVQEGPVGFLQGLGLTMPAAVLLARPMPAPTAMAVAGLLGRFALLAALQRDRGPYRPPGLLELAAGYGTALLLAGAFLAYAVLARPSDERRPSGRRGAVAAVLGGAILLALSFLVGGHWMFLPLWPLPVALVAFPALAARREAPHAALAALGVLAAGMLPLATCAVDPWSDAVIPGVDERADARPERVLLATLGGSGASWATGGGFTGERVECPAWAAGAGVAWDVALVAASLAAVHPRSPLRKGGADEGKA